MKFISKVLFGSLLFSVGFMSWSCSSPQQFRQIEWTKASHLQMPTVPVQDQFQTREISVIAGSEQVERFPQMWVKAEVEGAYLQKISSNTGEPLFLKTQYVDRMPLGLTKKIEEMHLNRFAFLEKIKNDDLFLKTAAEVFPPKVIVKFHGKQPLLVYQIDFVPSDSSFVQRYQYSPKKGIVSRTRVGNEFEQTGFVFPNGPKQSDLREVPLDNLIGDGTLTSRSFKVIPQTGERAISNDVFRFEVDDFRFDQVQTYFFVNRALAMFRDKLNIIIPFPIEVQTQVGAPAKQNIMFYYHGQIRLGIGDGINYQNIMKDPSIVTHETCHALVETLANLPFEGEGGSLNEGFSDYFTASLLNNPRLGEVAYLKGPFRRTVENSMTVVEKNGGLYHDSGIVSGTFWELKSMLGTERANLLTIRTISRLGPLGDFSSLADAVQQALDTGFSETEKTLTLDVLKKRKWL